MDKHSVSLIHACIIAFIKGLLGSHWQESRYCNELSLLGVETGYRTELSNVWCAHYSEISSNEGGVKYLVYRPGSRHQ